MAVLVALAAIGVCTVAAAVMVPTMLGDLGAWPVLVGGFVLLVGTLGALWTIQKKRDRTLR